MTRPDGDPAPLAAVAERFVHAYDNYGPKRKNRSRYLELRPGRPPRTLFIKGVRFLITPDEREQVVVREHVSILIEGSRIKAVLEPHQLGQVNLNEIDLLYDAEIRGGLVVTPGFVNAHAHPPMYLLRSSTALDAAEGTIEEVLEGMVRLERAQTAEEHFLGAVGDFSEQQKMGTTTVLSHYHLPGVTEAAARTVALRLVDAVSVASRTNPQAGPAPAEAHLRRLAPAGDGLVTPALAMHSVHETSPQTFAQVRRLTDAFGCRVTVHCAESRPEVEACLRIHGRRPVEVLADEGLLDQRLLVSHAVHLEEDEIAFLAQRRVGVCHLPTSNKIHRSGEFKYALFQRYGALPRVALGTDSVISKNRLDLASEALQARIMHQHSRLVRYPDLFRMITSNAARVIGLEDVGRVLPGYRADLAFWKLRDRGFLPYDEDHPDTLIGNMITHGGRNVRDLMIDGQFVIINRVHARVNESKLMGALQASHMALRRRVAAEHPQATEPGATEPRATGPEVTEPRAAEPRATVVEGARG